MRVGFVSLYSWRPHVEHLYYLAGLVEQAGHEVRYLTCDADMPTCYIRQLRPQRSAVVECTACRLGGVRSYTNRGVSSIGALMSDSSSAGSALEWAASSASTIGRFEADADYESAEFHALNERLAAPTDIGYRAAKAWIKREGLDAVVVFNGRMDGTRGIMEAARDAGIRSITMERTWFGDGLQLLPDENCLGLKSVNRMVADWADVPLTRPQAFRAAGLVAARFLRTNTKEWRAYNTSASINDWPVAAGKAKVLLVPGSRNEVWGHPDWEDQWSSRTASYDQLMAHLGLGPDDVVLRAHPNWAERIGARTGELSERFYRQWAEERGVPMIPSHDNTSTLGLIEQADLVVVHGGSAALEAGMIGKRVVGLSPSNYQYAGFVENACSPEELVRIGPIDAAVQAQNAHRVASRTLRFCYTSAYRLPQFASYVRCLDPTRYEYFEGAAPQRIIDLIDTGYLAPDDDTGAGDEQEENAVLQLVAERQWERVMQSAPVPAALKRRKVTRRPLFRLMDRLRAHMPRGDV